MLKPPVDVHRAAGWILAFLLLALTVYFGSFLPVVASGKTFHVHWDWVPALGVKLSFTLDGLSLLLALLISGIGTLVLVYASRYMAGREHLGRFYALLLMFTVSMLGLVLADNLLLLFVFWELTGLCSYFLIGFDHQRPVARAAALQALLVTGGGGLALMAGVILLAQVGGSLELSILLRQGDQLRAHPLYSAALLLILAAAFTKSAQFPFHFWLPSAMEAPTPVSAYLHSATMVKAGVYLLARLSPALGGTDLWLAILAGVGGTTMLVGGWLALTQSDLKRILAYSTVSSLGMLTFLLGLGGTLAIQAAMAFLLGHALYKGTLFFVAGALDHQTGTRHVDQLSGLGRAMPLTAVAAVVAALSMAGLPPLFGFIAKEMSYEATLHGPAGAWASAAAIAASALLVAAAALVGIRPFFGSVLRTPRDAREAPPGLLLGPMLLAALSIVFALWPGWAAEQLISAASASVLGQPADIHLALWHGFTPALALSAVTLVGGAGAYAARGWLLKALKGWEAFASFGPAGWYEAAIDGLNWLAVGQTRLLQTGYLRYYLMITVGALTALVGYALLGRGAVVMAFNWSDLRFYEAGLAALILLAVVAAVLLEARLAAIAALGVVGYGVSLLYVVFGAPDLAVTQFLVETLTVILFVLVFYHLPASKIVSGKAARVRDASLAASAGAIMTVLVLVGTPENYLPISEYFEEHSVSYGHGRNVVNVILVDFRALDTLGEITVLSVAAVGVYALLKLRKQPESASEATAAMHSSFEGGVSRQESITATRAAEERSGTSLIFRSATRLLLPLLLLFSLFLLVRGHNDPGGGFSAGLVAAAAFVLYRFAFGAQANKHLLPVSPVAMSGAGILVAAASGIMALAAGRPLLTGLWGKVTVPGFGDLDVGTPLLFDVGVFIAVVGVTLSIILPLADE